jgi:hypothetical protein
MIQKTLWPAALCFLLGAIALQSQVKTMPAPSGEGVDRGQPFDRKVTDASVYAGGVYFIWGAEKPKNPAPAVGSKYLPYSRDNDRTHTFEWYKANHPDWIVYTADRKTPAYGYFYPTGNAMSLDITNPAAREFYYATYVEPFVKQGYPLIAFDNVNLTNWDKRSGHYDAQGKWVQQFSGDKVDPAYVASILAWMQYLATRLHAEGLGVAANITFPLGMPELLPAMRRLVEIVDLWCDEQGFTKHNDANINDEKWQQKFEFVRSIEKDHMHWAVNETTTKHLADASQAQIDWAVANYYLYREKNSMLTVCGAQEYGVYMDTPAMHINLGHALAAPVHQAGGAWTRSYSRGMVAVNPASKRAVTVELPQGIWVDSHGKEHSGKMELGSISAVLLTSK